MASRITFLAPADFATIYDLPAGLTGAGTTIGIVAEARTDFADFNNFNGLTGSTFSNPTEVVPTAFGGIDPGPAYTTQQSCSPSSPCGQLLDLQGEATLDVLRSGSVAPGASLLSVVASSASGGVAVDAEYIVESTPAPAQVMTISFGACESEAGPSGVDFWDTLFQQAAGEGISVFVSSGDSGASGCDAAFLDASRESQPEQPKLHLLLQLRHLRWRNRIQRLEQSICLLEFEQRLRSRIGLRLHPGRGLERAAQF